jgi:AraC-like DNA-binding protein
MMFCDPANRRDIHRIAEQVGFSDASTYSRAFRRNYQCSPTDARALSQCGIALPLTRNHSQTSPVAEFGGLLRHIGSRSA